MNPLSLFLTKKPASNGALIDPRQDSEKNKDYKDEEVNLAGSQVIFQNPKITKLPGTVYSQERTNSCVPHAFFTQLEYEGIIPFGMSQLRAYRKRSNYPAGGSAGPDMYSQIRGGQNPNVDAPVFPGHTDALANAMPYVAGSKLIKDFNYFFIGDYTRIPGLVANNKAIAIFIYASDSEWSKEYVEVRDNVKLETASVRHAVTLVKRGDFTENGKRWLTVHDSSPFGGRHLRYISYDFLLRRCYYAAEVFAKGEIPTPPAPPVVGNPTIQCKLNDKGQAVINLQSFLIKGKFLEPQYLTGFYGSLTAKAVLWWQLYNHKKFTSNIPELLALKGESWGPQSIAALDK